MRPIELRRWGIRLFGLWCVAIAVFGIWPQLDLIVAGWFWTPAEGFDLQQSRIWSFLRYALWNFQIALFAVSFVLLVVALTYRPVFGISARMAGFVFTLFLLGPGLLVNVVFKDHGGRARPADISQFGGHAIYTPPWTFADQCVRNCAFPSGEMSSVVVMAIVLWLGTAFEGRRYSGLRGAGVVCVAFVAVQRITDGRHFLSDVVFAGLMVGALAWGLCALFFTRIGQR